MNMDVIAALGWAAALLEKQAATNPFGGMMRAGAREAAMSRLTNSANRATASLQAGVQRPLAAGMDRVTAGQAGVGSLGAGLGNRGALLSDMGGPMQGARQRAQLLHDAGMKPQAPNLGPRPSGLKPGTGPGETLPMPKGFEAGAKKTPISTEAASSPEEAARWARQSATHAKLDRPPAQRPFKLGPEHETFELGAQHELPGAQGLTRGGKALLGTAGAGALGLGGMGLYGIGRQQGQLDAGKKQPASLPAGMDQQLAGLQDRLRGSTQGGQGQARGWRPLFEAPGQAKPGVPTQSAPGVARGSGGLGFNPIAYNPHMQYNG